MTFVKLDFDDAVPDDLIDRISWVLLLLKKSATYIRVDRTRRGYHVTVAVRQRLSPVSTVALQAILGSDWKREAYNLARVRNLRNVSPFWRARWNVLYQRHNRSETL